MAAQISHPASPMAKAGVQKKGVALLADREWLDEATKTIGQFWKRKNARRNGLATEEPADAVVVVR